MHLAANGHVVYGTVRSLDKATKLNAMAADAGVEVNLVELDVADDDSVRDGLGQVLAETGRIVVLVNNAGIGGNGVVEEAPIDLYADVMNVNVYGAIRCLKAVLPGMRERRAGAIVNITSVTGRLHPSARRRMSLPSGRSRDSASNWPTSWRRSASAPPSSSPG